MTLIQKVDRVWRVMGTWGRRDFPQCQCRSEFYDALAAELRLDPSRPRADVAEAIRHSTWDATTRSWIRDTQV